MKLAPWALVVALALGGCGGGSGSSAAPAPSPTFAAFRVTGTVVQKYASFDGPIQTYMTAQGVRAAQFAFAKNGTLLFSHAYTNSGDPSYPTTQTDNVMRLASNSKAFASAAITTLYANGAVQPSTPVFAYLGVMTPLLPTQTPDSRINSVTVQELVDHTAGFPTVEAPDPLFMMRDIEVKIGSEPLTKAQFASYIYGQPLLSDPGTTVLYSNVGYQLMGMIAEKASAEPFIAYLNAAILGPLGIANVTIGSTNFSARNPKEIVPDDADAGLGPSVFDLSASAPLLPLSYGGGDIVWEVADSAIDLETNAESMVKFIDHYAAYGLGSRSPSWRNGCVNGVATFAMSRSDGIDFAVFFNKIPCVVLTSPVIQQINALFDAGV